GPQRAGGVAVSFGKRHHGAASHDHNHGITDRLGRELVLLADFKPENVAREIKGANLPTAVVEDLVSPHSAAGDLVDIFGGFVFAENFLIWAKCHLAPHKIQGPAQVV